MKAYYVELQRVISFGSEVEAETEEDAQNKVLMMAPGEPRDWSIFVSGEVKRFDDEKNLASGS